MVTGTTLQFVLVHTVHTVCAIYLLKKEKLREFSCCRASVVVPDLPRRDTAYQKAGDYTRKHSYRRRLTYMLLLTDHHTLT